MTALAVISALDCMGGFCYILHIRKQLAEWLDFLKSVREAPERNFFVKGNDLPADINFELNGILKEWRRQFVKQKRAEAASRQLLTSLSHDIRTPLASLIGYLEALDVQSVEEKEDYIHVAFLKALDLQELVDLLFQWFKLASDEQRYQIKVYDINELTRELLIEHIPFFEKKHISFSAHISDEEWLINIDRMAYARMISNLFSNAIKHGKCSSIEVEIQKRENENRAVVSVSNNGTAIPENELPFVFERLYQCNDAHPDSGSGLGLAVVRELAHAMSGEITVQNVEGKTTFYLTFPLGKSSCDNQYCQS